VNKPLVSIIIPAYNHENYVQECLDSIIGQTYQNIELILINDGSKDDTNGRIMEYEEKLKKRFSSYTYINKQNEGITRTLNKGLDISNGVYIIPFASDDVMFPKRVELQVEYLENNKNYGMVYADCCNVQSLGRMDINIDYGKENRLSSMMDFAEGDLKEFMLTNVFLMPTPAICIRRDCYSRLGKYDETLLCEDPDMFLRISCAFEIGCLNEVLVLHRIHGSNSGRNSDIIVKTVEAMIKKYSNSDLYEPEQRKVLLKTLKRAIGRVDYSIVFDKMQDKLLIGWGTGDSYRKSQNEYKFNLKYLVDSNPNKQGNELDGKMIFPPQKLLVEKKDHIYILVFSQFYKEIYEWLTKNGFEYIENYY